MAKLGHFSRYLLEMLYTYTPNRALSHIFRFLKIRKFSLIKKRSFFKILKIRDSSLIETFIFNLHSKANRFYLTGCLHDSFPQTLVSAQNRENMTLTDDSLWRHLWPAYQSWQIFLLSGCAKFMAWRLLEIWRWSLCNFGIYRGKTRGVGVGQKITAPPCQLRDEGYPKTCLWTFLTIHKIKKRKFIPMT